jgi:L-glyceraldehyde 3-phosphate reductase
VQILCRDWVSWGVGAAGCGSSLTGDTLNEANLAKARGLDQIAGRAAWPDTGADGARLDTPRPAVTSTLVGASSVAQLEDNLAVLDKLAFSDDELAEIDQFAREGEINLWAASSQA